MEELKAEDLKGLFLFQLLQPEDLERLLPFFHKKIYLPGMKIVNEKDRGESMCVLKSGTVKITKKEDGQEKELIQLGEGDFFGEIALFDYAVRTASVTATENVVILEINRNDFNLLFTKFPQIVAKLLYQMMTEMSRRLRRKNVPGGGLKF